MRPVAARRVLLAVLLAGLACDGDPTGSGQPGAAATSTVSASGVAVAAGSTLEVGLVVRDASGTEVRRGGDQVVFGLSGGTSTGTIGSARDNGDGTYSATLTGQTAGTPMTVTARLNGDSVTTPLPTVAVVAGGTSPTTSVTTVSSATLDVGSFVTITLETYDAEGNRVGAGGSVVSFADSGGTSQGTIGAVSDNGDGSYSARYTGEATGSPVTILTTLDGTRTTTPEPTLAVTAGPPSPAMSELESSSDTISVGAAATLTLRTRDANGVPLSLGGRTVTFTVQSGPGTSDGVIETDSVDLGNGSYTARFRGTVAGSPVTIGATVDGQPVTSTLPTVAVVAVAVSPQNSVVTASDSVLTAGDTLVVTLQLRDDAGNDLAASGMNVTFGIDSVGGGSWGVTDAAPVVDNGDGSYTGLLLARVAGAAAPVGATVEGTPVEMLDSLGVSHLPTLRITPDTAVTDSSSVSIDDSALDLGQTTTVRLVARDGWGNQLAAGGLSVAFPLVGVAGPFDFADIGPTADHGDGSYSAPVTATIDGAQPNWIRPTINSASLADSVSFSVVCASGPVDLAMSSTAVDGLVNGDEIPSGIPVTLRFTARDAAGNCLLASGLTVAFATSGGSSTGSIGATIDNGDGSYGAIFTGIVAGTPTTILTTVNGSPVTSTPPTITVTPGDVSAVTSVVSVQDSLVDPGTVVQLMLQARDAAGNDLDNDTLGLQVVFSKSGGGSDGVIGPTTSNMDGTFVAGFTAGAVGTPVSIGAAIDGSPVSTALPTIEVANLDPDSSAVTADGADSVNVVAGSTVVLELAARDSLGRRIRGAGHAVTFAVGGSPGTSGGSVGQVSDLGDGRYQALLSTVTAGTVSPVIATIDGAPADVTPPVVVVTPGPLSLAVSNVTVGQSQVPVSGTTTVTLVTRDQFGNQLSGGGSTVVFSISGGTSDGTFGPVSDNGDGSYTSTFTGTVAGTPSAVGATVDGQPVTSPAPSLTVQ